MTDVATGDPDSAANPPGSNPPANGLTADQQAARAQAQADLALPQVQAFLSTISTTEGTRKNGYNTAYGGGRVDDLSQFPGSGKNTASGRYQILANTFADAQDALGLDDFSPASQDLTAAWLLHRSGIPSYLKIGDFAGALDPASKFWSSLPKGEGSWNKGRYDNAQFHFQKAHDFSDVKAIYDGFLDKPPAAR